MNGYAEFTIRKALYEKILNRDIVLMARYSFILKQEGQERSGGR